jgi:hypothetical protein
MKFGKPLFNDGDLSTFLHRQIQSLDGLIANFLSRTHKSLTDEEITVEIAGEAAIKAISIDLDKPRTNSVKQQVFVSEYGRPIKIEGIRSTYSFEFSGDEALLYLTPHRNESQFPQAEVRGSSVTIAHDHSDSDAPEEVKRELDRKRDLLREYSGSQERQIAQHNQELMKHVKSRIEARFRSLERLKTYQEAF